MAKVEAFLSLEKSISTTMTSVWSKVARSVIEKVQPLLEARRWDDAHDIANRLTLNGVVEVHRKRLEELAVSTLLFGAQNVTGSPRETSFVKGKQALPWAMQQALDQLTDIVEVNGAELVRNQLHAIIRRHEIGVTKAELKKDDIFDELEEGVFGTGRTAIDIAANLTASRLATLGFLSEAIINSIETYQISEVLDDRTCPVCLYMHGKTFDVHQEYSRVLTALGTMDPKELKSLAPWPSQTLKGLQSLNAMSREELQAAGFGSPPFHPNCRGVLVLVGTVTEEIPLGELLIARRLAPVTSTRLSLDIVPPGELRDRIKEIDDQERQQILLLAFLAGGAAAVEELLDEEDGTSGDNP